MPLFLIIVLGLFLLWDAVWWVLGVKPRFPWQLKARLDAGPSGLTLLDVRTPLEYHWFHLPGAINVPEILTHPGKMDPAPLSREVVVICMTGHRSPLVAYALKKRGYTRVFNLTGGMLGWKVYEWVSRWGGRGAPPAARNG
jgi:rhodanese-related sulfurtransferase